MAVGGDDDTVAGSFPMLEAGGSHPDIAELVGGRYRIIRWLGGGGMGRVYEAMDTELDERVALKVLRSGLTEDAIERFRREVKLTRRIQHRNVARMFDIGEHQGEKFLTMELVEGEPLTRLMSDKPMSWTKLDSYAQQICAGLAAAHATGVVHRDLKPDNVLIEHTTDRAVLTDFGIARGGDDPTVTQVGAIVGTPRYMAPEQLAGREVDARADLFSLGVMLFELATATRPWPGDNAITIAVSQATMAPRAMDTVIGAIPPYFASVVSACLQLDPGDRPVDAAAVLDALVRRVPIVSSRESETKVARGGAAPAPSVKSAAPRIPATPASPTTIDPTSIAVLPVTCAPGDEYLADGVFEDLTDTLSTTPGLRVRPAGRMRDAAAPDPRELGRELQVDHVVATSLRRTAQGLRISTRLTSVADGFQIWAHRTDCTEAAVLCVADELARGIAEALSTRATAESKPTDPRAVDLYLRARAELRRFWGNHAHTAADLLEQAVDYAPTSAPILAAAAYANVQAWVMRSEPELLARAETALRRGLATGHGEAYLASAQYHFNRGEPERGASDLARALVRAPMSANVHELAGKILVEIEGPAAARQHYETALGLDPARAAIIHMDLARIDALEQRWSDADARIATLKADPDVSLQQLGQVQSARLACWRGNTKVAIDSARAFITRMSPNAASVFHLVLAYQDTGKVDRDLWFRTLAPSDDRAPVRQYLVRHQVACELALALSLDEMALEALDLAVQRGLMDLTWMDGCPLLNRLVPDPRYAPLRRAVGQRAAGVLAAFRRSPAAT